MESVLNELEKLRNDSSINIIETLSNRFVVHFRENDGTKTAYFFSVPIRNEKNNNIVDLKFYHNKESSMFEGSEVKVSITDKARFISKYGQCHITFEGNLSKKTETTVQFKNDKYNTEIRPTLNGLMLIFEGDFTEDQPQVTLRLDRAFKTTATNNKYFSIMLDTFISFITFSCIGAIDKYEKVVAPCEVHYQKLNDLEYKIKFYTAQTNFRRIAVEINLQETKLFRDTTVESKDPDLNNVFGGISFLGTSKEFGEQWLYSRLEISRIPQIQGKKILKTVLHIPQLGQNNLPIKISKTADRFCSFGSTWNNKIAVVDPIITSDFSNGYYHLDVTKFLGNMSKKSENFVIKADSNEKTIIIPTGDNFYTPQILEVKYF